MKNNNKKSSDNRLIDLSNVIKKVVKSFFKKNWNILVMNIIIFILTVFIESLYFSRFNFFELLNAIVFIAVITTIFVLKYSVNRKQILISIPMLYLLFLIFLNYCTLRELYGISSLGLDKIPNFIDALFVVFAFTFFEYITVLVINKVNKGKKELKKA